LVQPQVALFLFGTMATHAMGGEELLKGGVFCEYGKRDADK